MFQRGLRNSPFAMAVYPARRHPPNLRVRRFVPMLKGTRRPALALAVLLVLAVVPVLPVQAQTIRLVVDGQPVFFDQPPVVIGGRVLVPLRGVFERLGAFVQWGPASNTVRAYRGRRVLRLRLHPLRSRSWKGSCSVSTSRSFRSGSSSSGIPVSTPSF